MATMTYTGRLVITSCWCGIHLAIPEDLYEIAQREKQKHAGIRCPLGHVFVYTGETEAAKLKRQLEWAKDDAARERSRADQAERSRRAWKGQATRARNRAVEGDCPLCGQHLRDLERHIGRVHPDEKVRELEESDATT